jgi:hypothetical protein
MRASGNPYVKLRLAEINRRSAELSAISSKLEEMVLQLDRLRTLSGRIRLLGHRNCASSRKHDHNAHRFNGNSPNGT